MRGRVGLLTGSCVVVMVLYSAWTYRHQMASVLIERTASPLSSESDRATNKTYGEAQEAHPAVSFAGPLADYAARKAGLKVETLPYKPVPSDHVGGSVVGTSSAILHHTFRVRGVVELPFEVPAHAATPQLRGSYRSFLERAGEQTSDEDADVEFLVLNEQQYDEFLNGHPGEAVFSAEEGHDQDVNTGLPPTFSQPAKYHLLFRNNSHGTGKKVVQADFRVDF
jgi:hypothetical protein